MEMFTIWIVLVMLLIENNAQYEGDECELKKSKEKGLCTSLGNCEYALNLLKSNKRPQQCGFGSDSIIVCCPPKKTKTRISGTKSFSQCLQYSKKIAVPNGEFIYKGLKSLAMEFPHMAILGFKDENDKTKWGCGGTLISEKFVLTAAHCLFHNQYGDVKLVRLGDLDVESTTDIAKPEDFTIAKTHTHPNYTSSSYYHDIALIELEQSVKFNNYIRPACLYPKRKIPNPLVTITGWGRTSFLGDTSSHLLKADINFLDANVCVKHFSNDSKLQNGFLDEMQICAGDSDGRDACPGDSGGPMQIRVKDVNSNMHYYGIVGITSFGKGCGIANTKAVYTRVAHYISWIEDLVWQD